jgi:hypothetical protein
VARYRGRHAASGSQQQFWSLLLFLDFPTLVLHEESAQIVPVKDSAQKSAKLIIGAEENDYPGARTDSRPRIRIESTPIC